MPRPKNPQLVFATSVNFSAEDKNYLDSVVMNQGVNFAEAVRMLVKNHRTFFELPTYQVTALKAYLNNNATTFEEFLKSEYAKFYESELSSRSKKANTEMETIR